MAGGGHHRSLAGRRWEQNLVVALGVLVTLACVGAAGAVGYVYARVTSVERFSELEESVIEAASTEPLNIMVVGSDSRENLDAGDSTAGDGVVDERADTIIVARIEPASDQIELLSFPRDLVVDIAGSGDRDRINAAYGEGREVLIDTIRQNFGIEINHYIEVDFTGFQRLVDAIGGVPVDFDTEYRDRGSFLQEIGPGCVTLNGLDALAFARARALEFRDEDGDWQTDTTGDLGRITRQQLLVQLALGQVQRLGIGDALTLNSLLDVAVDSVGVDPGFSIDEMRALAARFSGFDPRQIETLPLPTVPRTTGTGAKVLELVEAEAQPVLDVFRDVPAGSRAPAQVSVSVQNGSGVERQAADVTGALAVVGFDAEVDQDPAGPLARTTIYHGPDGLFGADLVARHLTAGAVLVRDPAIEGGQVRLVTGTDLTTVQRNPNPQDPAIAAEAAEDDGPATMTTEPPGVVPETDPTEACGG